MTEQNPYSAPQADLELPTSPSNFDLNGPKAVGIGNGWQWISSAFTNHFKQSPGAWIGGILLFLVFVIGVSLVPILGQIAVAIFTYVFIAGFMLGCKAQTEGEDFQVTHIFAGFSKNTGRLVLLSVLYNIGVLLIFGIVFGGTYFQLMAGDASAITENLGSFYMTLLIALLLIIPLIMAVWFAAPLIVINDLHVIEAMKMSFMGCLKNMLPFFVYGILLIVLYFLAIIPLLLGLLVFLPVGAASMYTSYRDIFID